MTDEDGNKTVICVECRRDYNPPSTHTGPWALTAAGGGRCDRCKREQANSEWKKLMKSKGVK